MIRENRAGIRHGRIFKDSLSGAGVVAAAHVFVTRRNDLKRLLTTLNRRLEPTGFVWVSWPKKASKVATDITEDTIRSERKKNSSALRGAPGS